MVRADVLRDTTGLACHDVGLADVVEERRLAMVDVTHDRDHRRAMDERRRIVGLHILLALRGVLLLTHGLEAVLARNQLDLVELETLIDRLHEPEVLERKGHDLRRRDLQDVGKLADRDELVYPHGLPLTLGIRHPLRFDLFARRAIIERPAPRATTWARAQRAHRARDVR